MNTRYIKVGPNLVPLQCTDEETWPPWLRKAVSIGFVAFIGLSLYAFLVVTP